jgi:RNA polymerase sigma-70 factor (TIGR02960 family)
VEKNAMDQLERARNGDAEAFAELLSPYRRELQAHCYRILGSIQDAEDALQETLVSAWQGFSRFEGRSSLRTWLYSVATNRSLDALRSNSRHKPELSAPLRVEAPEPSRLCEVTWLQPYPDTLAEGIVDHARGPEATVEARDAISLAFITALQRLSPRQRAVLILKEVLGFRAVEVADMLETSEESVTSALKRARATLDADPTSTSARQQAPPAGSSEEQRVVERFVKAFSEFDVDGIVDMLTEDATVKMPPMPFEYRGRVAAARFFTAVTPSSPPRVHVIHTRANGQPAFSSYSKDDVADNWRAMGLIVLTLAGDSVAEVARFDPSVLASFGLPRILSAP